MESKESHIKSSIVNLLAKLDLPKDVSLDNDRVLKLEKLQKHYSLVFVDKLLFRIKRKANHYILEFQREYC